MNTYWKPDETNSKGLPGRKQRVDWFFDYAGKQCCIPIIYRFPEGIVFDLLTILDEAELHAFYSKYKDTEESLSPTQVRAIEDEHPYQHISLDEIKINGKQPASWSSASDFCAPWMEDCSTLAAEAKSYSKQLNGTSYFSCNRYTIFLCPEPISRWERFRRWLCPKKVSTIEIGIQETTHFLPIELSFTLPYDFSGIHTETFLHPQTKVQHTLYIQNMEHEETQISADSNEKVFYLTQLSYEIYPALPEGDCIQFDNSIQWEPTPVEANEFPSSASIGMVIGISDGPTSIFLADKGNNNIPCGIHGLPLHTFFAKLSASKEETVNVVLNGLNTKWLDAKALSWQLNI